MRSTMESTAAVKPECSNLFVTPKSSIRQAVKLIDRNEKGIVLIVDEDLRLLGTITDGDIRRALLAGHTLDSSVKDLLDNKIRLNHNKPVTAPVGTDRTTLLQLMQKKLVRQLPIVDADERVVDLVTIDDLLPTQTLTMQAVIMAGGYGTRLQPLTETLPKPMLPVGNRPLMELIIDQLRQAGIQHVDITTHYKSDKIINHFGNGHNFGIELNYITEDRPLGTAGGLGLRGAPSGPLLVINGDILTRVNFRAMLAYHQEHQAALTVAVRKYDVSVPYGVIKTEGAFVQKLVEKPLFNFYVNAGIYLLDPLVYGYIPKEKQFNMTDLIQCLLDDHRTVVSFPIMEYWLDVGKHADYKQAQEDIKNGDYIGGYKEW
jgi:dTDP-glucose pyrophosphorylase